MATIPTMVIITHQSKVNFDINNNLGGFGLSQQQIPTGGIGQRPVAPLATSHNIMNLLKTPTGPQTTSTTSSSEYKKVYVGKIPPGLSDNFMLRLLEVYIDWNIFNIVMRLSRKLEAWNGSTW